MGSGSITVQKGYTWDEIAGEDIELSKLNAMVDAMVLRLDAGSVTTRELADGSITADKLSAEISQQLGVQDGSVTLSSLVDGILEDSAAGRLKMADGFLSADVAGRLKMATDYIVARHLSDGAVTNDAILDATIAVAKLANGGVRTAAQAAAFRVYLSGDQTVATGAPDKLVELNAESLDGNADFDTGTHLLTPKIAGWYEVHAQLVLESIGDQDRAYIRLYKNSSIVKSNITVQAKNGIDCSADVSDLIFCDGVSDTISLKTQHDYGSDRTVSGSSAETAMFGYLLATA
jgi:hypothetical protein